MLYKLIRLKNLLIFTFFIIFILILFLFSHKLSIDRYNNYVYGKFDLGNMNQMLYNTTRGNFMELTGYFGKNFKRWSMSHVDPSLLIFVPVNIFYTDASFLLFAQSLAFALSSFLLFFIAKKRGLGVWQSAILGSLIMLMPISGYILVWTTFHPLILAMPFLLGIIFILLFYPKPSKKHLTFFYIFAVLFILSKEELGLVLLFLVPYFLFTSSKKYKKHILIIGLLGILWSLFSFLYIIPSYSKERVEGLQKFVEYAQITEEGDIPRFTGKNYFLYRYEKLGSSYLEIFKNIFLKPNVFLKVIFTKEKIETFYKLLNPIAYSLLFSPFLFIASIPEILIQLLATEKNIFSITNHRLLILIPFMVLSVLELWIFFKKKFSFKIATIYLLFVFLISFYFSLSYKSPLLYTPYVKISQKLSLPNVFATHTETEKPKEEFKNLIEPKCVDFLLSKISKNDKISVPQPLGAKTSDRSFNALFPSGLDSANVVIADLYARKLMDLLDLDIKYNAKAVNTFISNNPVKLEYACGRFFLLRKVPKNEAGFGVIKKWDGIDYRTLPLLRLPLELIDPPYSIWDYDYSYDKQNNTLTVKYIYTVGEVKDRDKLFTYTIIKSKNNPKERWQFAHFPSFYYKDINDFPVGEFLYEEFTIKVPDYISKKGLYNVYAGLGTSRENDSLGFIDVLKFE